MKHTLFILALITASIQTFAQSPRIKLNQIVKDTVSGSVLISSPTDSGMVYSRDLFISYGADTVLILGADTVTLQSDLVAEIADSLLNYVSRTELSDSTTNIRTDIPLIIADSLLNYVTLDGTQTISGAKTFTAALNQSGGDVSFDSGTLFVDESADRVGIGTSSPNVQLHLQDGASEDVSGSTIRMDLSGINPYWEIQARNGVNAANRKLHFYTNSSGSNEVLTLTQAGNVGIGTTSPTTKLEVEGNITDNIDFIRVQDPNYDGFFTIGSNTAGGFYGQLEGSTDGYDSFGAMYKGSLADSRDVYVSGRAVTTFQSLEYTDLATKTGPSALENSNAFDFANYNVSLMMIEADGDVGIGTTTPSYKLDVNGNVRADTYYYDVTSTLQSSSDSRLKQNITDMDNVLDKLKELELVKYEWNDNMYKKLEGRTSQSKLGGTFEGMIAQQVESLFPQYVGEDADGYKTLSYVSFIIPLLKGFQEQQSIIESQATEIEQLKSLITELSNRLQILENN